MESYIYRIGIENSFINSFEKGQVLTLLRKTSSNYAEDYFNICEPILLCTIGREFLNRDIFELDLTTKDIFDLNECFSDKTQKEIYEIIFCCVKTILKRLSLDEVVVMYFSEEIKTYSRTLV